MKKQALAEYGPVFAITLLALALCLAAHFYLDSMFNVGDDGWRFRLQLHQDYYPFSARTFTTYPAVWLGELLGGRFEMSFALVEFFLFIALGPLLYRYLRALGFDPAGARGGMVIFYLSYPMIAAFHEPVCSWDDFWQYGALILAFTFLVKKQPVRSVLAFAVGVAAREPTLLIYPVWAYAFLTNISLPRLQKLSLSALPLIVAAGFWLAVDHEPAATTIHSITENFRDVAWTRNSLYSLFMGLGWLWLPLPFALYSRRVRNALPTRMQFIRYGSLWATLIVVAVVLWAAYARETRLFFPPFVFVIPLVMYFLKLHKDAYRRLFTWRCSIWAVLLAAASLAAGIYLSNWLFPDFDYRSSEPFARLYFGLHVAAALWILIPLVKFRKKAAALP